MINLIYDDIVHHLLIEGTGTATLSEQLLSQAEISMSWVKINIQCLQHGCAVRRAQFISMNHCTSIVMNSQL